jgi:hypothetical protein
MQLACEQAKCAERGRCGPWALCGVRGAGRGAIAPAGTYRQAEAPVAEKLRVAAKEERALEAPAQQGAQGEAVARGAGQVQHEPCPVEPREAVGVRTSLLLRVEVDERRPICAALGRLRHSAIASVDVTSSTF